MAQPLQGPWTRLPKSGSATDRLDRVFRNGGEHIPRASFPKSSSLTNALSVAISEPNEMPPQRPSTLGSSAAFSPYTPPAPPPTTTPLRRPSSAYLSCMVPASSRGSLPRRPTSLYDSPPAGPPPPRRAPPFSAQTWNPARRPHSIAGPSTLVPASPSDSGYRSLTSSVSDHHLVQSRSALAQLRPRPSPTFHGLPFRPFTCGLSPSGAPIFLGCTHLHPAPGVKPRTITPTTSNAIRQLLLHPRNGFRSADDKVALFFEILDSQDRFAKVISRC